MSAQQDLMTTLMARAEGKCDLCTSDANLSTYLIPESTKDTANQHVLVCAICATEINSGKTNAKHWACLNESMWSQTPAVQAIAWRLLKRHKSDSWATDALDMLYLDDEVLAWAEAGLEEQSGELELLDLEHVDSNGSKLTAGDTVVLIKDLNVKGAGFTAKRGTAVRNISLSLDNASHIEGRVSGQQIVILTEFVKKS